MSWTYDQGPRRLIPRLPEDPTKPLDRSPGARHSLGLKLSKGRRSTPRLPEDPTTPPGAWVNRSGHTKDALPTTGGRQ